MVETAEKQLLRFIICGSVDDGKSSLLGRLLYASKLVHEDELAILERDSKRYGTQGSALDLALLVDGLAAEREQAITIDVAYRFFSSEERSYIVADTPGHAQYTRNMVTAASTADCAVLIIDARKGLLEQSRRHAYLASLLGVSKLVIAINKMDLVGYAEARFTELRGQCESLARQLGASEVTAIPVSATQGDNVVEPSENMPWYGGPTLMRWLDAVEISERSLVSRPLRFPVQWVNRPHSEFRGFAGTIASGTVRVGDRVRVQPEGPETRIARIVTQDGDLPAAGAGHAVTLTLTDEVDVSRGDLISAAEASATVAAELDVTMVWMSEVPANIGRHYLVKIGPKTVTATLLDVAGRVDVETFERVPGQALELNEIGDVAIALDRPVAFDRYTDNRDTGGFIVIDRRTNQTVGAGMIRGARRVATNVHRQHTTVDKAARAALCGQRPRMIWLTGLPGSGKSTIANALEVMLHARGRHTFVLDGDNLRHGLNEDLSFTMADRAESARRVAEVGKLMVDAGLIVIAALVSPLEADRAAARRKFAPGEFVEVFVDTPLETAAARDPKGLYERARRGEIAHFTGVSSPFEPPTSAELRIDTTTLLPDAAATELLRLLEGH